MATGLRLLRFSFPTILNSAFKNTSLNGNVYFGINRFIFTETCLGVNGYVNSRSQVRQQFLNIESSFRQKMSDIVKNESGIIFTEDLKVMLHLTNKNPEEIDLVIQMMRKFNNQNKELRFGTYIFGPVVMRTFYYLDEPDIALNTFFDSKLTNFFDQTMSYTILMTLLYKHDRYNDIKKVYDFVREKNVDILRFPRNPLIVCAAACYKENTPEALEYSLNIWKELAQKGFQPLRRVITFIAALAIKQNAPEVALEILSGLKPTGYIDIRCLKILTYCKMNRLIDVITILKSSIEKSQLRKESYFIDVIQIIEKYAENADESLKKEIARLIGLLRTGELISSSTLESHIVQPIDRVFPLRDRKTQYGSSDQSIQPRKSRVGLKDLL